MLTCPVCEHQQAGGTECENCGKVLVAAQALNVPITPVEGLEGTRLDTGVDVPVLPIDDLDSTRMDAIGEVPVERIAEFEGANAPVGEVAVERVELSEDRVAADAPTPVDQGPRACRYCRAIQPTGLLCGNCGMRLPPIIEEAMIMGQSVDQETRCKSCGVPGIAGNRCKDCGTMLVAPEE